MKTILLTGVTGQVGQELKDILPQMGKVIAVNRQIMDLTQAEQIKDVISKIKPDIIVNSAAYTAVDKAETEVKLAEAINAIAPSIMAREAEKIGATLIQISTDYVFDGTKPTPYVEDDITAPLGIYGKSKLRAEQAVRENCRKHIILRTAWVYGCRGHGNFVKTMLRLGAEKEQLQVVSDQIGSPTWAKDIAQTIGKLIQALDSENPLDYGTYHFTNSGVASWYDFAVTIFATAQKMGLPLKIKQVLPITTADYPTPAPRPAFSVLSNQKITAALGEYAPHWQVSLRQMLKELTKN